jgi:glc operon protein GlcG
MHARQTLSLADARRLIDGARHEADARSLGVSIAVTDEAGTLIALERLDTARYHTPTVATAKARTAAIARTPTKVLQAQLKDHPAYATFPDRVPIEGGIPIIHDNEVVGAIGVSGGTTAEDTAICEAAIAHFTE